ncbi:DUF2088 domain-containing protein [bacterium]|nr:DUF2088 domain-containing protein [bacterium]
MPISTPFGDNASSRCDINDELLLANLQSDCPASADFSQTVYRSLGEPLGFPPLAAASVPGDVVLFALGSEVTSVEEVVQGIVQYAVEGNLPDRQIQFLLPQDIRPTILDSLKAIIAPLGDAAQVIVHQPQDQRENAFLTSTQENRAIILNRHLCDADVVVPIDVARNEDGFQWFGPFSSLYPTFSDIDSQKRCHSPLFVTRIQRHKRRAAEVEEVRQLLGIAMNMLLVPADGGAYHSAIFGEAGHVEAAAANQMAEHWQPHVDKLAGAIVALITGGQMGQTWHNAARALANVEHLVRPGGAIILATEIREHPGLAMAQMGQSLEFTDFEAEMRKSRHPDAAIALQFARTLSNCKIYFRSQLPEDILDQLDLIPVESDDECRKICEHYQDVVIVHDAQSMAVRLADTSDAEI